MIVAFILVGLILATGVIAGIVYSYLDDGVRLGWHTGHRVQRTPAYLRT